MKTPEDRERVGDPWLHGEDRWEALVRRILAAAAPELARLRIRKTLAGQVGDWTRPLLPLAALLIVVFGSLLAWVSRAEADPVSEAPFLAEVLMPDSLVLWLEGGAYLTLAELVGALEEDEG